MAEREERQLSPEVQARLDYCATLDDQRDELEIELEDKIRLLETEYKAKFALLDNKLRDVVSGKLDVVDGEAVEPVGSQDETGIPNFWFEALQTHPRIEGMIMERDVEVLKYLTNITNEDVDPSEIPEKLKEDEDLPDYETCSLVFHFAENPFFTNKKLTKSFIVDEDGASVRILYNAGCEIHWKSASKNVTIKVMKKKAKGGGKKGGHAHTKEVPVESFFNFFADRVPDEDLEPRKAERMMGVMLEDDLENARAIAEICEHPVDWYTGDALEDYEAEDSDYDDDEEDYSDDYSDEDDEDDDESSSNDDEGPGARGPRGGAKPGPKGGAKGGPKGGPAMGGQGQPQDCKQQ